jgi:hypothetical protein
VLPPVPGTPGPPDASPAAAPAAHSDTPWYLQGLTDTLRESGIWLLIAAVGLVGLWGLLAPAAAAVAEKAAP